MSNSRRANALPFLRRGPVHSNKTDNSVAAQGFVAIAMIFARTWPFLKPYILGYWRELTFSRDNTTPAGATTDTGLDGSATESNTHHADGSQWSFKHIPPLATLAAALGPITGVLPYNESWLYDFLLFATFTMAALSWCLLFAKKKFYVVLSTSLFITGAVAFLFAVFVVDGLLDNVYIAITCALSAGIWMFQYQFKEGRLRFRVRLGSHLIYYFVGVWASTLLLILISLFSVDVVSQSILQAKPLTPFIADLIADPEQIGRASCRERV